MNPIVNGRAQPLDRSALYAVLDQYLAALKDRDPGRVRWSAKVYNTENNVALMVGDGLWGTITGLGAYDLRFCDEAGRQVGWFGTVDETDENSAIALRLKVDAEGAIAEVETLVVRQADSGLKFEPQRFETKSPLMELVEPARRGPRERLVSIANGYFDTLQLNDGTLFVRFHPDCQRVENGVQTTNNPEFARVVPVAALSCEAQLRLGNYRYDDRLRARRFELVDEERGLVFAAAFIDHCGRLADYRLTDGRVVTSHVRRPHSFYLLELFKIEDGMIRQIEANFITVPYNRPSPWDGWHDRIA
jgi:hypothetical protein